MEVSDVIEKRVDYRQRCAEHTDLHDVMITTLMFDFWLIKND